MNIIFYMENNRAGGVDSFFINLINHWPSQEDSIILICNKTHPGLKFIKNSIKRKINYIVHDLPISWVIIDKYFKFLPIILKKYLNQFLRVLLCLYQYNEIKKLLLLLDGDKLMVINGSYPGGETSRLVNIAWKNIGKKPGIHNFHNFSVKPRFPLRVYENFIDRLLLNSTSHFVSVSNACSESLRMRENFKQIENIKTIYNGILIPKEKKDHQFNIRKELKIDKGYICLMLASYEERKGHKFLFRVFEQILSILPSTHLVVCGDSDEAGKKKVKSLRKNSKNKDNIHLLDYIENGSDLIYQSDILLVASQSFESFGLTVAESMIRRVPVISTNIGGLTEVIGESGKAGFCLDPNNFQDFSEKIFLVLTNPEIKKKLVDNGYKRVVEKFNVKNMSKKYYELINK